MQHDSRAYLWDVRQAADAILEHLRVWRIIQETVSTSRSDQGVHHGPYRI